MFEEHLKRFKELYITLSCRYSNVFENFVKMCAITIYNSFAKNQEMEKEYLRIINLYKKEHQNIILKMFAELVMMYENSRGIIDILGQIYEELNLGNSRLGQFFTPSYISDFMAEITLEDENTLKEIIKEEGFVTMHEPACGGGRYGTFSCKCIKKKKY